MSQANALFITATGTDAGKTYVTALIVKKLRQAGINAGYYKAALSGVERIDDKLIPGDARHVYDIAGIPGDPAESVSYVYETAISPHLAAVLEGNPVELSLVKKHFAKAQQRFAAVCVEGSGGIICPLRIDEKQTVMLTDVIQTLGLDILIVAPAGLGAINSTVLTVEYARAKRIKVRAIILNNYDDNIICRDNRVQIECLTGIPVIACVKNGDRDLDIDVTDLIKLFQEDREYQGDM